MTAEPENYTPRRAAVRVTYGAPRPKPAVAGAASPAVRQPAPTKWPDPETHADTDGLTVPRAKRRLVQASLGFAQQQPSAGVAGSLPGRTAGGLRERVAGVPRKTQAFLSFGQRPVAVEPCKECGMTYQRGRDDDEAMHKKFHRGWQQRQARVLAWDAGSSSPADEHAAISVAYPARLAAAGPNGCRTAAAATIRCVGAHSQPRREVQRALDILNHANDQLGACTLGLAELAERQRRIFLYVSPQGRVEGCILAEAVAHAQRVAAAERATVACTEETVPAVCGISRIWVAPHARRSGVASQMIAAVRRLFVYGCRLRPEQLAFTQPTADGRALAERVFGRSDFLVYVETGP
ncbi:hypothetical protein H4R19_002087 [Coemansia spiralis]|nr:hypothetical protein H4R19_002087 [Coemansia spiralis]